MNDKNLQTGATRRNWLDNLRWVTVLLVLLYHVIYFYNNKGVFGGIGGFGDGPQYQDVVMYILYPWFMPLLFLLLVKVFSLSRKLSELEQKLTELVQEEALEEKERS